MGLRQNTLKSETNSIDVIFPDVGYPLKECLLKKWIYAHHFTLTEIAEILDLPTDEFKKKLCTREKFDRFEIRELVYLMGAKDAFNVIYFPTKGIRKKVWNDVFGKYEEQEEKLNE